MDVTTVKEVLSILPYLTSIAVGVGVFAVMRYRVNENERVIKELKNTLDNKLTSIVNAQTKLKERVYGKLENLEKFQNNKKPVIDHLSAFENDTLDKLENHNQRITELKSNLDTMPGVNMLHGTFTTMKIFDAAIARLDSAITKLDERIAKIYQSIHGGK